MDKETAMYYRRTSAGTSDGQKSMAWKNRRQRKMQLRNRPVLRSLAMRDWRKENV